MAESHPVPTIEQAFSVSSIGAELSGTLWKPVGRFETIVLMIPGSGRSTRDCDDYFPAIRTAFLRCGIGVAAFDKRGAGRSSGSFYTSSIENQAEDARRCIAALRSAQPAAAIAVFGHSQGGWVAFELAAETGLIAAAVSNSGPALGPAPQEHFRLRRDVDPIDHEAFDAAFGELVTLAEQGAPYSKAVGVIRGSAAEPVLNAYLHEGSDGWKLLRSLLTYSPAPALEARTCPTLVVHGENDVMVPVQASLESLGAYEPDGLRIAVISGADHRLQTTTGALADGYLDMVTQFIVDATGEASG